ncbi:MAG TPA: formyltransferase family protein [Dehalococcoidales bacterium]|nr:formyltransferase family protein [Dehalococcoidales bacterium]
MREFVYNPAKTGPRMTIVCFVSGSGTNYREIVKRDPAHDYLVFTNRPGCQGTEIARQFGHPVVELSHAPYLKDLRKIYGAGNVPRNCPERESFEKEVINRIETKLGRQPDLICLAGYDLVNTDWMVDRYYPRILNVHPGDSSLGYIGLHWVPAVRAIMAGEKALRSTLFFIDKGLDTGAILVQSKPLEINKTLAELDLSNGTNLLDKFRKVMEYSRINKIQSYEDYSASFTLELKKGMEEICSGLQAALKVSGDWQIYPFGVHDLIAQGRVEVEGRRIFVDGCELPLYGYRLDAKK